MVFIDLEYISIFKQAGFWCVHWFLKFIAHWSCSQLISLLLSIPIRTVPRLGPLRIWHLHMHRHVLVHAGILPAPSPNRNLITLKARYRNGLTGSISLNLVLVCFNTGMENPGGGDSHSITPSFLIRMWYFMYAFQRHARPRHRLPSGLCLCRFWCTCH